MTPCPLAAQLFTFREQLPAEPAPVLRRLAHAGFQGVEPVCTTGLPDPVRDTVAACTIESTLLKRLLDDNGLVVSGAHTALPEPPNANAVLDEQELLGNDLLIVAALNLLPGGTVDDLNSLDTLKRTAERFNQAAVLAASRGMRIGYHNHYWEWTITFDGRPAYDVFWDYLDPEIVAEVDIYWAQAAGQDPARVLTDLGHRAKLVHVKDGPAMPGPPMTAVGTGSVDIAGALLAGTHLRWHIIEFDHCASDLWATVESSVHWLAGQGLSIIGKQPGGHDDV